MNPVKAKKEKGGRGNSQKQELDNNLGHLHDGSDTSKTSCSFTINTMQRWTLLSLATNPENFPEVVSGTARTKAERRKGQSCF